MRKTLQLLGVATLVLLVSTAALAANRGTEFKRIGFIDNPGNFPASLVTDMNGDGSTLVTSPTPYGGYCTLTDVATLEWTLVGQVAGRCQISDDGTSLMSGVYSNEGTYRAAIWQGTVDEWTILSLPDGAEPCGSSLHSFFGMGGEAEQATGLFTKGCSYYRGFKWDAASGISTDTYTISNALSSQSSRGNAISDDGDMLVGWNRDTCGGWRGSMYVNGAWEWVDGGEGLERKVCGSDSSVCCGDSDCPEFVDAYCDEQCIDGFCGPGPNEGNSCTSNWQCDGFCVNGPDEGNVCTSSYYCTDVGQGACADNPNLDPQDLLNYKGEAMDTSADGNYVMGKNFGNDPRHWSDPEYDPTLWGSAYVMGPGGDFTQIGPPPTGSPYDTWTPYQISDNGKVVVGSYGWNWQSFPVIWTEETGTLDLQWFLVGQGLDELWSWYLTNATSVNADGTIIGGHGYNDGVWPNRWIEGFVIDISKAKICHKPGTIAERTLGIGWTSIDEHLAHGDVLSTCEFMAGGAHSRDRMNNMRPTRPEGPPQVSPETSHILTAEDYAKIRTFLGGDAVTTTTTDNENDSAAPARRELSKQDRIAPKTRTR